MPNRPLSLTGRTVVAIKIEVVGLLGNPTGLSALLIRLVEKYPDTVQRLAAV